MAISIIVACRNPMDNEVLCASLKQHRRHFDVVSTAVTSKELLSRITEHQPHIALINIDLQDGSMAGLKVLRELRRSGGTTSCVMLLDCENREQVIESFSAGARGVVCKTSSLRELFKCFRCVHAGQIWANSQETRWIVKTLGDREPVRVVSAKGIPLLTRREGQIVKLVAEGLPNREISSTLGISPHTVKNHLFRIYEKLGVSNRVEVVLYAQSDHERPHGEGV